jgi:peptidoglycan-N-acetylglucosamine deacetylase
MYLVKTPAIVMRASKKIWWRMPAVNHEVYLTFDDGPSPAVTSRVLRDLDRAGAKATFFMLGRSAVAHPQLVKRIIADGHAIGSHSHSHPDALHTTKKNWLADIRQGREAIEQIAGREVKLFRPPYGRLWPGSLRNLGADWQCVLWDVMPGDFDMRKKPSTVRMDALTHIDKGSIVVLHDSEKAAPILLEILPSLLSELQEMVFQLRALPPPPNSKIK